MLTISIFWFAVLIIASLFIGFWMATQYTTKLMEVEYERGATDVVKALAMAQQQQQQSIENSDVTNETKETTNMSYGFDTSVKGDKE